MRIKNFLWALALWVASLLALGTSYLLSNLGLSLWLFGPLLGWMLTFGLPTTLAFHGLACVWSGLPLWAFLATAALLALPGHLALVALCARRSERSSAS